MKKLAFALLLLLNLKAFSQPIIGAQVYIEPGQSKEQIDQWFKILSDQNMPVARLFMMWQYMEPTPGNWDFTLYDQAFDAAAKHNVKIVATLMANHGASHYGYWYTPQGGSIPKSEKEMQLCRFGIQKVVNHFANHKAMDTWMLHNEPGQFPSNDSLAIERFKPWLISKYQTINKLNNEWLTNFKSFDAIVYDKSWEANGGFAWPIAHLDWQAFWREHMTWYLSELTKEIKKIDTKHGIHVNPHGLFDILHTYELPKWNQFLTSLGASIHPVWHLGLFNRDQFPYGISFISDFVREASLPNPFWVTELQGGHNIFSASTSVDPKAEETANWIWNSIGSGADRIIYWCLNWRNQGGEAGEWSLLNFQNKPTERLKKTGEITKLINDNKDWFTDLKVVDSKVDILLNWESTAILYRKQNSGETELARSKYGQLVAALGIYKSLLNMGINANIKFIETLKEKSFKEKRTFILPHTIAMNSNQIEIIKNLSAKNHKIIVTGLTGMFNEKEQLQFDKKEFWLTQLSGQSLSEIKEFRKPSKINIGTDSAYTSHWYSLLSNGNVYYKNSNITWIPSSIDVASWTIPQNDISNILSKEIDNTDRKLIENSKGFIIHELINKKGEVLIINNIEGEKSSLVLNKKNNSIKVIYGDTDCFNSNTQEINIPKGKTVVLGLKK